MDGATDRGFARYAAIDWSGAAAERPAGIAVAVAAPGEAPPRLIGGRWSRREVAEWILAAAASDRDMLIGLDFSFALPFVDRDAYLPGWAATPPDARRLWRLVEAHCANDPHLGVATLLADPQVARHFRQRGRCGDLFGPGRGRLRRCEAGAVVGRPVSAFNLVGPAQVGKGSLTGMRMLARLDGRVAIWPIDPLPRHGTAVVEIYPAMALHAAGRRGGTKIRDAAGLDAALATLGSAPAAPLDRYDDHRTDALVTAAWLRRTAVRRTPWHPETLTRTVAATEGWTFGVA